MNEYPNGLLGTEQEWEQAKRDNEQRAAHEAENAATLQRELDELDAFAWMYLKPELLAEKETVRITSRQRADYAEYRAYAREHGWPHDDARTLFAFLASDLSHPVRVRRLHNSVQSVIHSTGLKDITNDFICVALMRRLAQKDKSSTSASNKEEANGESPK